MKQRKNKYDSWTYTAHTKESRNKVKRLRKKAERRLIKYGIEDELLEEDYLNY